MTKIFLLLTILLPFTAFCQKGNIKGNVYFKFNDYIGNRADAGTAVVLISQKDKNFRQETKADLQGDYSFSDLDSGKYLVILSSKNTVQNRIWTYDRLKNYPDLTLSAWADDFQSIFSGPLYDSITIMSKEYFDNRFSKKGSGKKLIKLDKELAPMIDRFYEQMLKSVSDRLALVSPVFNMRFQEVTVKNGTSNVVTDFGPSIAM